MGKVASLDLQYKKKNDQRFNQSKEKWNQTVVSWKAEAHAQTDNMYNQTDDITRSDKQSSQHQSQNTPTSKAVQKREMGLLLHIIGIPTK